MDEDTLTLKQASAENNAHQKEDLYNPPKILPSTFPFRKD